MLNMISHIIQKLNLVTNPVISDPRGKDRKVFATNRTYPWSFVRQIFHTGQPCHGDDRTTFAVMTSYYPTGTLGSVASSLAAALFQ